MLDNAELSAIQYIDKRVWVSSKKDMPKVHSR